MDLVLHLVGFDCWILFSAFFLAATRHCQNVRQTQALAEPMIATLLASSEHIDKNMVRRDWQPEKCWCFASVESQTV